MAYLPRIIIQTTNRGRGWHKEQYLVTPLALLSFQPTSVFLSAYLETYGYSQIYFRKIVTLSMDLRAINLLVAAMIRFKNNLLRQILVLTRQHHVLANNWCHVLSRSPRQISSMLFGSEGLATWKKVQSPLACNSSWCWVHKRKSVIGIPYAHPTLLLTPEM